MSVEANDVMETMKRMEWQRAKGHLLAMLETYYSEVLPDLSRDSRAFDSMSARVNAFIAEVEGDL